MYLSLTFKTVNSLNVASSTLAELGRSEPNRAKWAVVVVVVVAFGCVCCFVALVLVLLLVLLLLF